MPPNRSYTRLDHISKHIGEELNNQIWMITHSDTLLREAVEEPFFSVFHMQSALALDDGENQLQVVSAQAEIERAIIDMVGDLATYAPRSKIVILEGGGDSEFDVNMVSNLFPQFSEKVNLISGGNKHRVLELHDLLDEAATSGKLDAQFFSIVDRDITKPPTRTSVNNFYWDAYHIENYLLNPYYIRVVLESI